MRVSVPMQYGEALVLYDLLRRYHEGAAAEMVPDRAERAVLIRFLGQLERRLSDGGEPRKAQLALERRGGRWRRPTTGEGSASHGCRRRCGTSRLARNLRADRGA